MITRRGLWLGILLLCGLPTGAGAQTAVAPNASTVLQWDHNGINVDRWLLTVDAAAPVMVTPTAPATLPVGWSLPFPSLTPGPHTLTVSACNLAGCGVSDPLVVRVIVVPDKPTTLRIGIQK